jgi:hypothetical protein
MLVDSFSIIQRRSKVLSTGVNILLEINQPEFQMRGSTEKMVLFVLEVEVKSGKMLY